MPADNEVRGQEAGVLGGGGYLPHAERITIGGRGR